MGMKAAYGEQGKIGIRSRRAIVIVVVVVVVVVFVVIMKER